jgi:2,4-dienoyl-CoA reductase-like NADH-dependent reductase (Old Yellow Enzyme family)
MKISATDYNNALLPWEKRGNTVRDSVQICRWLEEAGVDAFHVSTGSSFPHPRNPAGDFPVDVLGRTYDSMISSGSNAYLNYFFFRTWPFNQIFRWWWVKNNGGPKTEGLNLNDARQIKQAVRVPVLCTGGFQTASVIRNAIEQGYCDGVSIARPLVANNDLVHQFAAGLDRPPKPCTYCNKCLGNVIENPLGCYEESRFESREAMIRQVMSVYDPPPFREAVAHVTSDVS